MAEGEKPLYDKPKQREMFNPKRPENRPREEGKIQELEVFRNDVRIILQTVNDNEYQAAVTFMEPPSANFTKSVIFPSTRMVVGKFAGINAALIQTKPGREVAQYVKDAIEAYPKARYVIGVGVGYAFTNDIDIKLADVLVSETISDFANSKFNDENEIEDRGPVVNTVHQLTKLFCFSDDTGFEVSDKGRTAIAYPGTLCCSTFLINNESQREKFYQANKTRKPIGGEMEGGELIRFHNENEIDGVIVIKGVSDYADGNKSKDWQFTAALAALNYTETQLLNADLQKLFPGPPSPPEQGASAATVPAQSDQQKKYIPSDEKIHQLGIVNKISSKYQSLGMYVGLSLSEIDDIHQYKSNSETCTRILGRWIAKKGHGNYPLSWKGLYDLLCDIEHRKAADDMKDDLAREGIVWD